MSIPDPEGIATNLRKVLNMHGHGFHYAVIRRGQELFEQRRTKWLFDGAEFPVTVTGQTTHIDFILKGQRDRILIVAECKRADPARALWCFARAPYTWRNSYKEEVVFEGIEYGPDMPIGRRPYYSNTERGPYHLGFELKTAEKGDGLGFNNSAINQAVSQVLRGTSGLMNHLFHIARESSDPSSNLSSSSHIVKFIPAIFTTAQLWVTDTDLGGADLTAGELPKGAVKAESKDWIWFTHNRSQNLKPDVNLHSESRMVGDLSSDLRSEFARSIAIIGADGIDNFLTADLEDWLRYPTRDQWR